MIRIRVRTSEHWVAVLGVLIGLTSAGCAGFDGEWDSHGVYQYKDKQAAMDDQVNFYDYYFTDKNHPPFGQR